jgi:hypothetical protein
MWAYFLLYLDSEQEDEFDESYLEYRHAETQSGVEEHLDCVVRVSVGEN